MEWINLFGRILFSMIFIMSGVSHLTQRESMAGYAASKGLPAPGAAVVLSGIAILVAGVMVLLGIGRLWAGWILFWFLVASAVMMHAFWKEEDPEARQGEMIHFMKDLALAGGALLIVYADYAEHAWPLSF